uniref:ATP synthase subunit alpha, mitochondrial n=1 Tax=Tanacetum cinerariifolium TaxID=118510 RepID=A0A6L2KN93_TANCI|nr:ATP synthase subunit alpha, mitochondrial [Tanacetum cinerariifolium]
MPTFLKRLELRYPHKKKRRGRDPPTIKSKREASRHRVWRGEAMLLSDLKSKREGELLFSTRRLRVPPPGVKDAVLSLSMDGVDGVASGSASTSVRNVESSTPASSSPRSTCVKPSLNRNENSTTSNYLNLRRIREQRLLSAAVAVRILKLFASANHTVFSRPNTRTYYTKKEREALSLKLDYPSDSLPAELTSRLYGGDSTLVESLPLDLDLALLLSISFTTKRKGRHAPALREGERQKEHIRKSVARGVAPVRLWHEGCFPVATGGIDIPLTFLRVQHVVQAMGSACHMKKATTMGDEGDDLLAPSCFNSRSRGLQRDIRAKKNGLQPQGVALVPDNRSSSSNSIQGRKAQNPKVMIYTYSLPEVDVEKQALMQGKERLEANSFTVLQTNTIRRGLGKANSLLERARALSSRTGLRCWMLRSKRNQRVHAGTTEYALERRKSVQPKSAEEPSDMPSLLIECQHVVVLSRKTGNLGEPPGGVVSSGFSTPRQNGFETNKKAVNTRASEMVATKAGTGRRYSYHAYQLLPLPPIDIDGRAPQEKKEGLEGVDGTPGMVPLPP